MESIISQVLIGVSYGLLLFMLAAGLTLIFSMMGVLNFAHASFYMLGAYIAYQISTWVGFWPALALAPASRPQVGARARAAVHLRPVVHRGRTGAGGLGPRGGRLSRAAGTRRSGGHAAAVRRHVSAVPDVHDVGGHRHA